MTITAKVKQNIANFLTKFHQLQFLLFLLQIPRVKLIWTKWLSLWLDLTWSWTSPSKPTFPFTLYENKSVQVQTEHFLTGTDVASDLIWQTQELEEPASSWICQKAGGAMVWAVEDAAKRIENEREKRQAAINRQKTIQIEVSCDHVSKWIYNTAFLMSHFDGNIFFFFRPEIHFLRNNTYDQNQSQGFLHICFFQGQHKTLWHWTWKIQKNN